MFRLPRVVSRKGRSDSLLTLPSDSEHDDDIYIDDQTPEDASTQGLQLVGETDTLLEGPLDQEKNILSSHYDAFNADGAASDEINDFDLLGPVKEKFCPPFITMRWPSLSHQLVFTVT